MTEVLIAGASGLVGGRLLEHLRRRHDVRVRAASRHSRDWPQGVQSCRIDWTRADSVAAAVSGVDTVINLASMNEAACERDPRGALVANAGGAWTLASTAAAAGVRRFVQLSTIKVYGPSPAGRIDEDTPTTPRSHYAITHRAAEDYVRHAIADSVILRLSNGFGAPATAAGGDAWDVIVNEFCRQAVTDHAITIRSSGQAWRSFLPLDDVSDALLAAMNLPAGVYNLGAASAITIREAAMRVATVAHRVLGVAPVVTTGPPSAAPPPALDYRIDKLRAAGFVPRASFDQEVERVLDAARRRFQPNRA